MITFLAIVHILACLGLVILVLLQDSKGGGVFTTQATSNSVLGAGGGASLAQTMTKVVAGIFAATCIGLSIYSARTERSVIDTTQTTLPEIPAQAPAGTPVPPVQTPAPDTQPAQGAPSTGTAVPGSTPPAPTNTTK